MDMDQNVAVSNRSERNLNICLEISYISISILSHSPYKPDTRKIAAQQTNRPFKREHINTVDYSLLLTNIIGRGGIEAEREFANALHYHPTINGDDLHMAPHHRAKEFSKTTSKFKEPRKQNMHTNCNQTCPVM